MERQPTGNSAEALAALVLASLALLCASGCRYARPNSNCEWPDSAKMGSLSEEAEFAEDLAIRYADAHHGPGFEDPIRATRQCMAKLFPLVSQRHGVTPYQVGISLAHGRPGIDAAEMLSFAALYAFAAYFIVRRVSRRYNEGRRDWAVMTAYLSLAVSAGGVLAGEAWCGTVESLRLGNGHLSYRALRIPWGHHRLALFIIGILLFWLVAAACRKTRKKLAVPVYFRGAPSSL
jgi:hypothetical protein